MANPNAVCDWGTTTMCRCVRIIVQGAIGMQRPEGAEQRTPFKTTFGLKGTQLCA